jgi:beta-lactamase class A
MMIAAPMKQIPVTTTAREPKAALVPDAFFTLVDFDFFARVPLLMRIAVLLRETSNRRTNGANGVPVPATEKRRCNPPRTRGLRGWPEPVIGRVAGCTTQFRDRPANAGARGRELRGWKHLESNASIAINGDDAFPMASTFKLPVLVELHAAAKAGGLRWDDIVEITAKDQHLGSGDITPLYDPPGVALSMRNIANLMMMISDNSAADICLARAGAAKVTARMRSLGVQGIRVDRSCQELILDFQGRDTATLKGLARDDLREALRRDPRPQSLEARFAADDRLAADPRDTATPNAMVALLEKIWRGQVVDRAASDAMLDLLKRCRTGENRLRGLLPAAAEVAHKTGTLGGVVNDVGIIYLPGNAGHMAIAVISKRTRASIEDVERAVAHIARYAYDYFLFTAN